MTPPTGSPSDPLPNSDLAAGQTVGGGRYVLKQRLGQGGMGVVWLAHDTRLREAVALKFLPSQVSADANAIDNLRRETLRSRRLSHPNIVRIYDLHEAPGEPVFLSMEYVDGPNFHDLRARRPLRVLKWSFLAPLVRQLCQALEYAHAEGILHRDLKPANLMLDANGRLKLADFGLARVLSDRAAHTPGLTGGGTLHYMSPQQASGHAPAVADDIYSLGATLYELLTSKPPFHTGDIEHQIQHTRPDPLPQRLLNLGLTNEVSSEVSALLLSCLAKDPEQRPANAQDILHWLDPIETPRAPAAPYAPPASAPSWNPPEAEAAPARVTPEPAASPEWIEPASIPTRRPGGLIWAAGAFVLLGAGLGSWTWWKSKPTTHQAAPVAATVTNVAGVPAPLPVTPTIIPLPGANPPPTIIPVPGANPPPPVALHRHTGEMTSLDYSLDGRTVASAGADGTIRLWSRPDGRVGPVLDGQPGAVNAVAFSPVDNRLLASGGSDGSVRLWTVNEPARPRTLNGHLGPVNSVVFARDGTALFSASDDRTVKQWDVATGQFSRSLNAHKTPVFCLALSPDGQLLVSGDREGAIRSWRALDGRLAGPFTGHTVPVRTMAFSADGLSLASAGFEPNILVWDVAARRLRRSHPTGNSTVQSVAWADSATVVFGDSAGELHGLDVDSGKITKLLSGLRGPVRALARRADGDTAMGSGHGTVIYLPRNRTPTRIPSRPPGVASAPDNFERIFNGRDLTGWEGDLTQWKAEGGCLNGRYEARASGFLTNRALFYRGPALQDFELKFSFRVEVGTGEVMYRATRHPNLEASGYVYGLWQQGLGAAVAMVPGGTRSLNDRLGHRLISLTDDRWHSARILARGNQLQHELDGRLVCDVEDRDRPTSGLLALQLRGMSAIQFSNICLKRLPAE